MGFCWVVSLLLSIPQAIMFRKVKHPNKEFHQCTSEMVIEMNSKVSVHNGKLVFDFFGLNIQLIYLLYHFSFLLFVYFLPLLCIIISYACITKVIQR